LSFFRESVRLDREFHRLLGKFMAAPVIFLAVMYGRHPVRVRGQIVEFRRLMVPVVPPQSVASLKHGRPFREISLNRITS
jgi:hypothetical protein